MNWAKENKFLAGFLAVVIVGTGVLIFLVLGAKSRHDEALAIYEEKTTDLNRLQRLPTFPNQKNLDQLAQQKKQASAEVAKLAQLLSAQQIPLGELSPTEFQDRLKAAVNTVKAKAAQSVPPVKFATEGFFLGFNRYETTPPDREAAAELGRQLKAIEWVVTKLVESRVTEITTLNRPELPEEGGSAAKVEEKGPQSGGRGPERSGKPLVRKLPFEITFVADQEQFRSILNEITSYKGQFFIPRVVTVKTGTGEGKGPARTGALDYDPAAAAAAATAAAAAAQPTQPDGTPAAPIDPAAVPAAPAPATPLASEYIVGEEKVTVTLLLETVEFAPTPVATK